MDWRYRNRKWFKLAVDSLLWEQSGNCAICDIKLRGEVTASGRNKARVDHDHKTGKVRGILCPRCSQLLGWYEQYKASVDKYLGIHHEDV
jgi:Recombination endonuclease VII